MIGSRRNRRYLIVVRIYNVRGETLMPLVHDSGFVVLHKNQPAAESPRRPVCVSTGNFAAIHSPART